MADVYKDYLRTIGNKFESLFGEIKTDYGFDAGDEFEIALCKALKFILPEQYGVCRGTVFTIDGRTCGDDVILFDKQKFPTLRLLEDNQYAQKQHIPIEAVVAYIEAKNTIVLEDGHSNSLDKAISQCTAIKKLGRKNYPLALHHDGVFDDEPWYIQMTRKNSDGSTNTKYPLIRNPFYTCIFARGVREKPNTEILESKKARELLSGRHLVSEGKCPDLIIFDHNLMAIPFVEGGFASSFYMELPKASTFQLFIKDRLSWGIGISLMFNAFENIRLGAIDWKEVTVRVLELTKRNEG